MATLKKWTDEELQILHDMAAAGRSQLEVAVKLGRTKMAVARKASKEGVRFVRPLDWTPEDAAELARLYDAGVMYSIIAERLGYSETACMMKMNRIKSKRPGRRKRRWNKIDLSNNEMKELVELYKSDIPVHKIAAEFGVSKATVIRYIKERGLKTRKEYGNTATRKDKVLIPFGRLCRYYIDLCMSEQAIADREGCKRHRVRSSLRHYGIEIKSPYERRQDKGRKANERTKTAQTTMDATGN